MAFETKLTPVNIGLTQMLEALWDEIQGAAQAAQTRGDARFVFEEAEIEVAIGVEAKAEGKLSLYVAEIGTGLTSSRTATVRIKVKQYTSTIAQQEPDRYVFLLDKQGIPSPPGGSPHRPASSEEARKLVAGHTGP